MTDQENRRGRRQANCPTRYSLVGAKIKEKIIIYTSSVALDHIPKVDCTLAKYPLGTSKL
jgi:hypothetical protein